MKFTPVCIAAAMALFLWGCGSESKSPEAAKTGAATETSEVATPPGRAADLKAGKAVYDQYCHFCHGEKGYGDGPVGLAITPHPADFVHDKKRMSKTDAELLKSIAEGIQKEIGGEAMSMPAWKGILSEKEMRDVLEYIRELERMGKAREAGAEKK